MLSIRSAKFLLLAAALAGQPAFAQCRIGSGPDFGDGVPYCDELDPDPDQGSNTPQGSRQWLSYSAAVAWGEGKHGVSFVFVEKYFEEEAARDRALSLCNDKGWKYCEVADSVTNGVIVVGRQNDGNLRTQRGATASETIAALTQACAQLSVRCKVERVVDGLPEFE